MRTRLLVLLLATCLVMGAFASGGKGEAPKTRLIYMTAGDVNMLALGQNVLGPGFQEKFPNVNVTTIHTGPGNAGSQMILEKLQAEQAAGKKTGDVDVAMVHEIFMNWALSKGLLLQYAQQAECLAPQRKWIPVTRGYEADAIDADEDVKLVCERQHCRGAALGQGV